MQGRVATGDGSRCRAPCPAVQRGQPADRAEGIAIGGGDFHVRNWPTQLEPAKYERFVFGILLILMMIFRPAGLLPEGRRRLELQQAKAEKQTAGEA